MPLDLDKYRLSASAAPALDLDRYKLPSAPQKTGFADTLRTRFNERTANIQASKDALARGEQGKARTVFQAGGQFIGAGVDTALTGLGALLKPLPKAVKEPAKAAFGSVAKSAVSGIKRLSDPLADTGLMRDIAEQSAGIPGKDGLPRELPIERDIKAGLEYLNIAPVPKGAAALAKSAPVVTAPVKKAASATADAAARGTSKALTKGASIATGVPDDVLARAASPERAAMTERAIKHVLENEKEPFLDLTNRAATGLKEAQVTARKNLTTAKDQFREAFPNAVFDVRPKIPEILKPLEGFRSSGLLVEQGPRGPIIRSTPQSPFSAREISELNSLLDKFNASAAVGVDDVLALRQAVSAAYDKIPLGVNGTPTPYHAVIMGLKQATEPAIDDLLPDSLKKAFQDYSVLEDIKREIGNKLIDGEGNIKQTAEQFLANLGNANKGETRAAAERFKQLTGIDLDSEVLALKDAQKLSSLFPATGARTQDVIRAIMVTTLGGTAGGPLGAGLGIAATSPRVVGKAATSLGKFLARKGDRSPQIRSSELSSPTPASAPVKSEIRTTAPKTPSSNSIDDIKPQKKEVRDIFPAKEPFPDPLKDKQLGSIIDRHVLDAQVKIDTIGRKGMQKGGALKDVLTTTKTNLEKALRDANMPTFADHVAKFDITPFTSLQAFKDALIEYLRNMQPGLSMKNVGRVHPEDMEIMQDFIDAVRNGKIGNGKVTPEQLIRFETEARRVAPGYGINPDQANAALANKFDTFLSKSAQKKGTTLGEFLDSGVAKKKPKTVGEYLTKHTEPAATSKRARNGDMQPYDATNGRWLTTASKRSKADSTSIGSAPTGKEGVSAQRAGTSVPFAGGTVPKLSTNDKVKVIEKATGKEQVRFVHNTSQGLAVKDGTSGIPYKLDLNRFDVKVIQRNSADAPQRGPSINSPEMIALENTSPKTLDPKSFKDVKDYIRAHGPTLYHGTTQNFDHFKDSGKTGIYGPGTYFYTGRANAQSYASGGGRVIEAHAAGKLASNKQLKAAADQARKEGHLAGDAYRQAAVILREQGYVGVKDHDIVTIFDTKDIKTTRQLADEYWEATTK